MKSIPILIVTIITVFFHLSSHGQNTTEKNILGCWQLNKMEFIVPNENSAQLENSAKNTVVCFRENGKFTTTMNNNDNVLKGVYHISPDEKTIYQNREGQNQGIDEPAQIIVLNEKELEIKTEYSIIYFKKVFTNTINENTVFSETKAYQLDEVKIVKRTHKNEQKSKKLRRGEYFYTSFNAKKSQSAKFFKNNFSSPKYLKSVRFKMRSSENNRIVNLLFYSVGEDGAPKDLLYNENIICDIKKGVNVKRIDMDQLNIEFPKNGIFVAVDILLVEQNKYFHMKKNPLVYFYEPGISGNRVDEYLDTWHLEDGNHWKKTVHMSLNMQIVTSE